MGEGGTGRALAAIRVGAHGGSYAVVERVGEGRHERPHRRPDRGPDPGRRPNQPGGGDRRASGQRDGRERVKAVRQTFPVLQATVQGGRVHEPATGTGHVGAQHGVERQQGQRLPAELVIVDAVGDCQRLAVQVRGGGRVPVADRDLPERTQDEGHTPLVAEPTEDVERFMQHPPHVGGRRLIGKRQRQTGQSVREQPVVLKCSRFPH